MALSASDIQGVYGLLTSALSADVSIRKTAESALSQCESRPGFCSCLLEIIAAKDLISQVDVRLLASVYFKNGIVRYWRHRRDSPGISNEEKVHLRNKLMLHIREENHQIALQLAVLISKIARIDYPKEWPELFSILAQQLQSADAIASYRIFMVLFRTLKELSTKRLTSDQKVFSEIAAQLFDYCWKRWQSDAQRILQNCGNISQCFTSVSIIGDEFFMACERWLLCSKIIRQLVISGHPSDVTNFQEVHSVREVCPLFLNAVQSFLPYYSSFQESQNKVWEFIKKTCTKLMKILVSIQARHPYSFGNKVILMPIMEFCLNNIANPEPAVMSFEPFLIQCMVMVKTVLECKEYKLIPTGRIIGENGVTQEERKKVISNTASATLGTIFSSERIILLCSVLMGRYFIFTAHDLDEWNQNPESFHHEQDMIQWTEKLRPCAEALYIVLFENYKNLLAPIIVSFLHDAMNNCPTSDNEITPGMLLKDAAYTAAGHVYYELSNYLNFDEWFNGTLALELSNSHPNLRIIHRKIALLLGQWVSECILFLSLLFINRGHMALGSSDEAIIKIKGDTRKLVYCALMRLLQHHDIAVKLAACRSLCFLIQDCNFSGGDIHEFLLTCCTSCFKMVEDVHEFDSKVQILNLISVLIEHAAEKIIPFASQLMAFFQKIWEESSGESLLQIQLLSALRNFVLSLGCQSPICYNMLLPILQSGIDINNPDELNLLEDGVLLWEAILSQAPSMGNQLLEFFPYLVPILERSLDHLQVAVNIIEDYIISGGTEFLQRHASHMVNLLDFIVGSVNEKGLLSTLPVIDILIQLYPNEVPPLIHGVLQKLFAICLSREDHSPTKATLRATSGAILARLLVMNTNYLAQLSSEPSLLLVLQQDGVSIGPNVLLCLVDVWLDKIDNVTFMQRKAYASALSIILTLRVPEVLDRLDEILSACTSVILTGGEDSNEESSDDAISSTGTNDNNFGYEPVPRKELQKRQLRASDPIKQLSLENMVKENLQACAALHGNAAFNATINSIHPTALAQLKLALKLP